MTPSLTNGSSQGVRISIFANHKLVRESLKCLIESHSGLKVLAIFDLEQVQLDSTKLKGSNIAVVYLEAGDPVDVIASVRSGDPDVRVVAVLAGEGLESPANALRYGAVGIVKAEQSSKLLIEAIRQANKGETWLNQALLSKLLEDRSSNGKPKTNGIGRRSLDALTPREIEVVAMIGKGLKSKVIAERLLISEATVRHHLSSIYGKLGIDDRVNLVIYAYEKGLLNRVDQSELS